MGWFRRRRDVAAEYQRLERQGNLAMRTGNQALLHRVQEGCWELQKELHARLSTGDTVAAGVLFYTARMSVLIEVGAGNWARAVATGMNLASAVAALEVEHGTLPPVLVQALRRHPDVVGYAAHRAGTPLAAAITVEGLTSLLLGDRSLRRSLAMLAADPGPADGMHTVTQAQHRLIETARRPCGSVASTVDELNVIVEKGLREELATGDIGGVTTSFPLMTTGTHALRAMRITGRNLVYVCAGPSGGAAVLLRPPDQEDGHRLAESVELSDLPLPQISTPAAAARTALAAQHRGEISPRQASDRIDELLRWTGDVVWQPILARWPHLRAVPTAIVPVGEVAALPLFTALVDGQPACARLNVTIAPSARSLVLAGEHPRPAGGRVLVAADPSTGDATIQLAVREAVAVSQVHSVSPVVFRAPSNGHCPPQRGLLDDLRGASIVHLACHGLLEQSAPLESAFLLGEPITLSTVLAEDLRAGSLIVLSACDLAGIGSGAPAEQFGFPAVLLAGGARSVVAALWPVPDSRKTVRLMTDFHRRLETAETPMALGAAIAQARATGAPSSVWGAFSHFGA